MHDIGNLKVPCPQLDEQDAIANILADVDSEIESLAVRLTKTKNLKIAMMQELLTGKTRLIQPEPDHA